MSKQKLETDYLEGLVFALREDLGQKGYVRPHHLGAVEDVLRKRITEILSEIQHRLYQDVVAEATDLARQINPKDAR